MSTSPIVSSAYDELLDILKRTIVTLVKKDVPDLNPRQLGIFLTCYLSEESQTVRGLAAYLNIAKPAVTRALDRLTVLNLIQRKPDPLDRRSVLAGRTSEGMKYMRQIRSALADASKPRKMAL